MEKLDINPRITRALKKARITKPRLVLETSVADLSRSTGLSLQDVLLLVKAISEKVQRSPATTALSLHTKQCDELQIVRKLSLGCSVLDRYLRGGILSQGITEISGESSSGKTQVCMQLCLVVQLPYRLGGLDGGAVFISTEDIFPSKRLQQMIPEFEQKYRNVFNNSKPSIGDSIFIEHAADIEALLNLICNRLPVLMEKMHVKLVVIDSIAALFRVEYSFQEMAQRSKVMNRIGARLRELSYQNSIPVVCVNQVSAVMDDSDCGSNSVTPCLGLTWSNLITVRLMLSRSSGYNAVTHDVEQVAQLQEDCPRRDLKVVFAPHLPNITCSFTVDSSGVHGIAE